MAFESEHHIGKSRDRIAEEAVDRKREGDCDRFTFKDGSFIEINVHWGWQQAFYPNGWNCTPAKWD